MPAHKDFAPNRIGIIYGNRIFITKDITMTKTYNYISLLLLLIVIISCSTGKKALQKGEYDKAVMQAVNRLRSNDSNEKARSTLRRAYQLALNTHLENVKRASNTGDPYKWERMVSEYQSINNLYEEIRRCPSCLDIIPTPNKYDNELLDAKQNAAAVRYNLGLEALVQKNIRQKAIEAHGHFNRVKELVPRYKDIDDKVAESLFYATLKVVVNPIPSPSRLLELRHEFFVDKINEYLHHNAINEYVRFYTPNEVRNERLEKVDHVIEMAFDEFNLGNIYQNNTEREISRDSVVIAEKDGEKIYGTVKATIRISEKTIKGGGVLDFRIFDDRTNKVITHEKMPSSYTWSIQWASYQGDERALNDEERLLVKRKELYPPSPQIMFEEFTAPIYDQVISKIRYYYRNI